MKKEANNRLMVITGPTASGKTGLAIQMALKMNGEVVSADSMQIYKGMDIGTAKPTLDECCGVPHYLIDVVEPEQQFSVAQYKQAAETCIDDILSRGKLPILVGGTGLYIKSITDNIVFSETVRDEEYRKQMRELCAQQGNQYIHKMLAQADPAAAARIHPNDAKRIIRALEVCRHTKHTMSEHIEKSKQVRSPYEIEILAIDINREMLYDRINKRVDQMMERGLLKEVEALYARGCGKNLTSMQGLGYKQLLEYLEGSASLEQAVSLIKQNTRRYAKRQLTWIKNSYTDVKNIVAESISV